MLGKLVQTVTKDGIKLDGFLAAAPGQKVWIVFHGVNSSFYSSSLLRELASALVASGFGCLLANNRGHDLCGVSYGTIPQRIGSQFENVADCIHDFAAWRSFLVDEGFAAYGVLAHSLGAVKGAYWLGNQTEKAEIERFIALSPPRLNTELITDDPRKGVVFREQLDVAKSLCESGEGDRIIRVRFPLPNWVSAGTFVDKYGSGDKYDYLRFLPTIDPPSLWIFGETEVGQGMANFRHADLIIRQLTEQHSLFQHRVTVIDGADHSYTGTREALLSTIMEWLSRA